MHDDVYCSFGGCCTCNYTTDNAKHDVARWMCGFTLKLRKKNAELSDLLGLERVSLVITKGSVLSV